MARIISSMAKTVLATDESIASNIEQKKSLCSPSKPTNPGGLLARLGTQKTGRTRLKKDPEPFTLGNVGQVAFTVFNKLGGASPLISCLYKDPTPSQRSILALPATQDNAPYLATEEAKLLKSAPSQNFADKAAKLFTPVRPAAVHTFVYFTSLGRGIRQAYAHGYGNEVHETIGHIWS